MCDGNSLSLLCESKRLILNLFLGMRAVSGPQVEDGGGWHSQNHWQWHTNSGQDIWFWYSCWRGPASHQCCLHWGRSVSQENSPILSFFTYRADFGFPDLMCFELICTSLPIPILQCILHHNANRHKDSQSLHSSQMIVTDSFYNRPVFDWIFLECLSEVWEAW